MRGYRYGRTFLIRRKTPHKAPPLGSAGVDPDFDELEKAQFEAVEDLKGRTDKA